MELLSPRYQAILKENKDSRNYTFEKKIYINTD